MDLTLDRKTPPAVKPPEHIEFPQPEIYKLANGIDVYQFDSGTQDVICIELVFTAGSWYQDKPFTAMATNLMLREGTRNYSSKKLAETLDYYGAHFENTADRDNAYVTLYSLNKHLGKTLPLLEEVVKNPVFPESEFEILVGKQRQMLEVNMQKVNFLARTNFNPILFGTEHPYGVMLKADDLNQIYSQELAAFHRSQYRAGNCTIIVAGKVKEGMKQLLENHFGGTDWQGTIKHPIAGTLKPSETKNHFIKKEGAVQSSIRMGYPLFTRSHPDFSGLKVLNTVLGGYFGSRLMLNLREDKGFTYGIGSIVVPLLKSGFLVLTGEMGADVTGQALIEIRKELDRLCNEQIAESELSLVRSFLSGEMLRSVDGPFAQAHFYRELIENGLGIDHFKNMIATIQQISAQQLQDLSIRYLDPERFYTLVVGPNEV